MLNPELQQQWWSMLNEYSQPYWELWKNWQTLPGFKPEAMTYPYQDILQHIQELGGQLDSLVLTELQQQYLNDVFLLWQKAMRGEKLPLHDRRFSGEVWQQQPYALNAALYLQFGAFVEQVITKAIHAKPALRRKIAFNVLQMLDAFAPSNFFAFNPEAQQKLQQTKGESLSLGIQHLLTDLQKGYISQTDETAFVVGKNLAITPGSVIFQNELIQLIQYKAQTDTVYSKPLLIVPPCINKYYILDLQAHNSFVNYIVQQGFTVYLVSWRNVDHAIQSLDWNDYIASVIETIHVAQKISGEAHINLLGFCVGGTMLATALAVLAERGNEVAASLTLLTTLLDFQNAGILEVFVDDMQVQMREQAIGQGGLMMGRELSAAFSSLRPNELIWNYVVGNYLKGETPHAFDLLYWNSDSTNLPGPMYCWYLRNTYLENKLAKPGQIRVLDTAVDLGKIDCPVLCYASHDDHIVPWSAAYTSMQLLNRKHPEKNQFLLGASGHIAGVINPPVSNKRHFWKYSSEAKTTSKSKASKPSVLPASSHEWLENSQQQAGSWWPSWIEFLKPLAGKAIKASSKLGNANYKPIEAAPGSYVKQKA